MQELGSKKISSQTVTEQPVLTCDTSKLHSKHVQTAGCLREHADRCEECAACFASLHHHLAWWLGRQMPLVLQLFSYIACL